MRVVNSGSSRSRWNKSGWTGPSGLLIFLFVWFRKQNSQHMSDCVSMYFHPKVCEKSCLCLGKDHISSYFVQISRDLEDLISWDCGIRMFSAKVKFRDYRGWAGKICIQVAVVVRELPRTPWRLSKTNPFAIASWTEPLRTWQNV
jgi:hypothetical protein